MIAAIPPQAVPDIWPHIAGEVERARPDRLPQIYAAACEGKDLLLVHHREPGQLDGVLICQLYPEALHVYTVSGYRLRDWLTEAHEALVTLAKELGRSKITGGGRTGWAKLLAPLGYEQEQGSYVFRL